MANENQWPSIYGVVMWRNGNENNEENGYQ